MATGIIGTPIKHSLSPALHSFWMKEHKIESIYNIYELEKKNISSFLNKTDKISVAQQVSKACEKIGFLIISGHGIPKNIINAFLYTNK